jgi:hypothetical protein
MGASMAWSGKKNVLAKYPTGRRTTRGRGGPVGRRQRLGDQVQDGPQPEVAGQRMQMEEIAVYAARDDKVTREAFDFRAG